MKNIMKILGKFQDKHNYSLVKLVLFSDGSGRTIDCDDNSEIFEFKDQTEMIKQFNK